MELNISKGKKWAHGTGEKKGFKGEEGGGP